jgi:hypothetical protein
MLLYIRQAFLSLDDQEAFPLLKALSNGRREELGVIWSIQGVGDEGLFPLSALLRRFF